MDIDDVDEYGFVDTDVFDLPEQNLIREDVLRIVRKYCRPHRVHLSGRVHFAGTAKNSEDDAASKMSDIEAVITFYCKKQCVPFFADAREFRCSTFSNETYEKGNGWIDLIKPLITLNYKDRAELYALFVNIRNRYIPR